MSNVISVTPDSVETAFADLPRLVRLAITFGSRLRRGTLHVTLPKGKEKNVIGKHSRVDVTGPLNTPLAQNSHPTELPETFSPDFRIIHEGGSKTNETRVPENCLRVTFCAFFVTRDDLG